MQGIIRKRDVVAHPVVTIQCFGWKLFFRTLVADHDRTFLELVGEDTFPKRGYRAPNLVARSAGLERRAMGIYLNIARRNSQDPQLCAFFSTLADQESSHAELLELCASATSPEQWESDELTRWQEVLPGLETAVSEFEQAASTVEGRHAALELMSRLEGSEINDLFLGVVGASSSEFVRAVHAFKHAEKNQDAYIARMLPSLDASVDAPTSPTARS